MLTAFGGAAAEDLGHQEASAPPMKYEAKVDLRNTNTSHALIVDLVGRDRRVLDVGCASGYVGETLKHRGCTVAGVEYDAEAAQLAKAVLDEVVVGDVGELDLVGHFGRASFDAVVFGDVLEHVVDPVSVLRASRPLLAPGGAVVISIPNVAHGAVRLSLMSGRFEYRPLGLLDDTHLRFFTRDTVDDLLSEAGFVAVDVRRTVAGVFDTEVAVRRQDFDDRVVEAVEDDPDATTYQFVVKAVPVDEAPAGPVPAASPAEPAPRAPACRVGLWAACDPRDLRAALVLRVTRTELAARIPGVTFRVFTTRGYLDDAPHTGGEPVEPLGELSRERLEELAVQLDCLVVMGELAAERPGPSLDGGAEARCPVLWSAVTGVDELAAGSAAGLAYASVLDDRVAAATGAGVGVAAVPDPLLLASRALRPDALARRLEFLKVMAWFPRDTEAVVVEIGPGMAGHEAELTAALRDVAAHGRGVVLVQLDPLDVGAGRVADELATTVPAHRLPAGAVADDVVAATAGATLVVASSPSGLSLALAYDRPLAVMDLQGGSPVAEAARSLGVEGVLEAPGDLAALAGSATFPSHAGATAELRAALDRHFDRLAAIADGAAAARPRVAEIGPPLPPSQYVAALETAHHRMQQSRDAERTAVADHLAGVRAQHRAEVERVHRELRAAYDDAAAERARLEAGAEAAAEEHRHAAQNLAERLADREREVARLRDVEDRLAGELEALRNIRTLRLVQPLRSFYGRIRRLLR